MSGASEGTRFRGVEGAGEGAGEAADWGLRRALANICLQGNEGSTLPTFLPPLSTATDSSSSSASPSLWAMICGRQVGIQEASIYVARECVIGK